MQALLRAHIDELPTRYKIRKDRRPHYRAYLRDGKLEVHKPYRQGICYSYPDRVDWVDNQVRPGLWIDVYESRVAERILYECYNGRLLVIPKRGYDWWRPRLKERAMLVAWDLPSEIRDLSMRYVPARDGGFTLTWFVNDNGLDNGFLPKLGVTSLGEGYSFRWRKPFMRSEHKYNPGRFLNLSQLCRAMRNEEMSLAEALSEWDAKDLPTLTDAVLAEFDAMNLPISEDRIYSSAGLAKAALAGRGIRRPRIRSKAKLGQSMTAYYGPRIETPIVRQEVPVTYVDFRSLYPAVSELIGGWDILTSRSLRIENYTRQARELVRDLERDDLFNPDLWRSFQGFCRVVPDGDVLPIRLDGESTLGRLRGSDGLWWALPDVLASKLLTGKAPTILEAWRIVPDGGGTPNMFVEFVNRRRQEPQLSKFLKVMANIGSYGIYSEVHKTSEREVTLHGLREFKAKCGESPGNFYFPPLAAITTSAARLMLALLQTHVKSFVFCDTDSMAIAGLSWKRVDEIRAKFQALNPFDDGDFLKLEDENFRRLPDGTVDRNDRAQLYAYALGPKEYCLYSEGDDIRKGLEYGMVYDGSEGWIDETWKARLKIERDPLNTLDYLPKWEGEPAKRTIKVRTAASWKQYGAVPFAQHTIDLGYTMRRVINRGSGHRVEREQYPEIEIDSVSYIGREGPMPGEKIFKLGNAERYEDRRCLCGCGTELNGMDPRQIYLNETHRKRVQRRRAA